MKHILLICCLLVASFCYGQNCDDIIKKVDGLKEETIFVSPTLTGAPGINAIKIIEKSGSEKILISFRVFDTRRWDDPKGLFIKFEDGTIIRIKNYPIKVNYESINLWSYLSALELDSENAKLFTTNQIVNFEVDHGDNIVTPKWGAKIKDWINCVYGSN